MNENFVLPKVYWVGFTEINLLGLIQYLEDTDQTEFIDEIKKAEEEGISSGEILCSFYAKMCYASLTTKKNKNISKVRGIAPNLEGILNSGHGSVLEHASLNFLVHDCSRVFTHELVRHRVGTAFSQSSGRYIRTDKLKIVVDPILEGAYDLVDEAREFLEYWYHRLEDRLGINDIKDFSTKKKLTSAMRRLLPNGQANEIGVTLNLRALRHTIEMRTSEHAEWEIRYVFNQIYDIMCDKYPMMFVDSEVEMKDGLREIKFKNKKV